MIYSLPPSILAILVMAALASARGTVVHLTPSDSVQAAIEAAADGDELVLGPGVYSEGIDLLGKSLIIRGAQGAAHTTLDASEHGGSVVTCSSGETEDTVLIGLTLTGGTGSSGNVAKGGGMNILASSPTIVSCRVLKNTASVGAGIHVANGFAAPRILNTVIAMNVASSNGGGVFASVAEPELVNCTVVGNLAGNSGGGLVAHPLSHPRIANSVIWSNAARGVHGTDGVYVVSGDVSIDFSDVQGGWPEGSGNLDVDPAFVPGSWAPSADSPLIDRGDDDALPSDHYDLDGDGNLAEPLPLDAAKRPRQVDGAPARDPLTPNPAVDLGALEFQPGEPGS